MNKKFMSSILIGSMMLSMCACSSESTDETTEPTTTTTIEETTEATKETTEPTESIIEINVPDEPEFELIDRNVDLNRFASFVDEIYDNDNIAFSPLSLDYALGMISNGANSTVIGNFEHYFNMTVPEFNDFAQAYIANCDPSIKIANSIWVRDGYTLTPDFKSTANEYYSAEVTTLPFNPEMVGLVNDWCNIHTNGKIPELLVEVPESDILALNALYFNMNWARRVSEDDIYDAPFTNAEGTTHDVPMMISEERHYYSNDFAQATVKMYEGGRYGLVLILPNNPGDFNLYNLDLNSLMRQDTHETVRAVFPKFEFDNTMSLNNLLKNTCLSSMYNDGAFDSIVNENDAYVSNVIQKTFIRVDENGTEAAAVTSVEMVMNAMPEEPIYLNFDRPFAFMIYDFEANAPLFMGKIVDI